MNLDSADTNNPLANLQKATNMFSQIVALYPTNQYGARAWGELGDCDVQLGDLDGATNAYAQVFNADAANASIRSAAQVGFGMALEKKARAAAGADQTGLQQLALDNYLDVFRKSNLNGEEVADVFWVKKAGLQAAGVAEAMGDGNMAATLYEDLKRDLPQLKEVLDKKIAAAKALNPLKKN
jgi:tetratricopeptide (TPR) repeat protein